jgi:hypothetical protein
MQVKIELSGVEEIKAAYMHFVLGYTQQELVVVFDGINIGRINEACKRVGSAVGLVEPGYKAARHPKKR